MTIVKRINLICLTHDYYLERINLLVYTMSSLFVHDSGLWPSSNIREHARRIVSRQKSEHDRRIPEYTFNENVLTRVCLEISSIESAFYVTDTRLSARKRSYSNSRRYFDAKVNLERSGNSNFRRKRLENDRNKNEKISGSALSRCDIVLYDVRDEKWYAIN